MSDPATLLTTVLGGHTALALAAVAGGLARYSERVDLYSKSIRETEDLLAKMRRRLTISLEERIDPFFVQDEVAVDPTIFGHSLDPTSRDRVSYREKPSSPVGTDRFREVVASFIEDETDLTMDYQETARAHRRWCSFATIRRWDVALLAVWELVCVGTIGFLGKILDVSLPDWVLQWSFAPTGVLIGLFLVCLVVLMVQQDVIDRKRSAYPGL
jgi:uncharacterized membrane protein